MIEYSAEPGVIKLVDAVSAGLQNAGQPVVKKEYRKNSAGTAEYFGILRASKMPGIILEPCFIDNAADRELITTVNKQLFLASSVAAAIDREYRR